MRQRAKRRRKKQRSGRVFGTFILVGLLAIASGWMINRLVVQGYLFRPVTTEEDPVAGDLPPVVTPGKPVEPIPPVPITEAELTLRPARFYLPQAGALDSESSARQLVQRLRKDGYPGAYTEEAGYYKVFAGIYSQEEAARAIVGMLQAQKQDGFVKEVTLAGVKAKVTGSSAAYVARAQESLTVIDRVFSDLLAAEAIDRTKASALKQQVDQAHAQLSELSPSEELVSGHTALLDACARLLATVNQLDSYLETNDQSDLLETQSSLMEFALRYRAAQSLFGSKLT